MTAHEGSQSDWQQVPIYRLDNEDARTYADLISTWNDLNFVAEACQRLLLEHAKPPEERDHTVTRALWMATLITYARCFGTGKRKGLQSSDIELLPLVGEVVEWHEFLINMRNKHVAHSVNPFEVVQVGVSAGLSGDVEGVAHLAMSYVGLDEGGLDQTLRIAKALADLISSRIVEQQGLVLSSARSIDKERLVQLPPIGAVVPGPEDAGSARKSGKQT